MYESLVPLLLDIGNAIFFIVNFPQLITAFKNRRNLSGLSSSLLVGFATGSIIFATVGYLTGGIFTLFSNIFMSCSFLTQLYWKRKYRK